MKYTAGEIGKMIKDLSLEKVPGANGLTAELYLNFKKACNTNII